MTVTTLEPTALGDHDFAISCGGPECSNEAKFSTRVICDCIYFWCTACLIAALRSVADDFPCDVTCPERPGWEAFAASIDDFIVSVHPL